MEAVTLWASPNEKAFKLMELPLTPLQVGRVGPGRRRYQILWLNRDDHLARHITDLGPAEDYPYPPIHILSVWEDSVASLRSQAEDMRWECGWAREIAENAAGESDLVERLQQRFDLMEKHKRATSSFGPAVTIERHQSIRR